MVLPDLSKCFSLCPDLFKMMWEDISFCICNNLETQDSVIINNFPGLFNKFISFELLSLAGTGQSGSILNIINTLVIVFPASGYFS